MKNKGKTLQPVQTPLRGHVTLPGSKSITNRALLLAALSKGTSRLSGALKSDDTFFMAAALKQMGVEIEEPDDTSFLVRSSGQLRPASAPLFLGNAGTAMRFLTAAAATVDGTTILDGDAHMRKRPIGPLVESMRRFGVDILAPSGCPPVTVRGSAGFSAKRISVDATLSSQYVSAILMASPCSNGAVEVAVPGTRVSARGYIDLTIAAMKAFGASVERTSETSWRVEATGYRATNFHVEPDASAATYFWAAAALTGGSIGLGLAPKEFTQPDAAAYELISAFPHLPPLIDGSQIQDSVPTLAVLAAFNTGPVRFTGIANLRVKECDRIRAIATELSRIRPGLAHEIGDDLVVDGGADCSKRTTTPVTIATYSDHRIAMAFSLAGLKVSGITIEDPDCVAKTFPGYWNALASLGVCIE